MVSNRPFLPQLGNSPRTITKLLHLLSVKAVRLVHVDGPRRTSKISSNYLPGVLMQNVVDFTKPNTGKINWATLTAVTLFHIFAVVALFSFSWQNFTAAFILWWVGGSLGIGIAYHRLLTHRGFTCPKWLEYVLSVFGTLALQSGPLTWVTTHRLHHAFTETDKDPHSPRHGTYWAHIGWIFRGTAQNQTWPTMVRYCPDITKDRFQVALNKYYYVPIIIVAIGLYAIGGFSMVLWGVALKTVIGWHFTWLVNSATHLWGCLL